uniref:Uncharacterized protein n=1 Tax=Arion vulgaris TaxID=1028688 RepID=A0A0B6Z5W8_9EUPU
MHKVTNICSRSSEEKAPILHKAASQIFVSVLKTIHGFCTTCQINAGIISKLNYQHVAPQEKV